MDKVLNENREEINKEVVEGVISEVEEENPIEGKIVSSVASAEMFEIAKQFETQGKFTSALSVYHDILESSPDSEKAQSARRAILSIAQKFLSQGKARVALSIFEECL